MKNNKGDYMTKEELETTTQMHTFMMETEDDERSIIEEIEELEEKIDYLDKDKNQKEKLKKICNDIKQEQNEETREYLFHLLQKEFDE